MRSALLGPFLAVTVTLASAAQAATTFDLTLGGGGTPPSFTADGLTLSLTPSSGTLTQAATGVGVDEGSVSVPFPGGSFSFIDSLALDGANLPDASFNTNRGGEFIDFSVSGASLIRLVSIGLVGSFTTGPDTGLVYDVLLDGGATLLIDDGTDPVFTCPASTFGAGFRVRADAGGLNSNFRVSSVTVAAVPLPAGGALLLAALGGLAVARRRPAAS